MNQGDSNAQDASATNNNGANASPAITAASPSTSASALPVLTRQNSNKKKTMRRTVSVDVANSVGTDGQILSGLVAVTQASNAGSTLRPSNRRMKTQSNMSLDQALPISDSPSDSSPSSVSAVHGKLADSRRRSNTFTSMSTAQMAALAALDTPLPTLYESSVSQHHDAPQPLPSIGTLGSSSGGLIGQPRRSDSLSSDSPGFLSVEALHASSSPAPPVFSSANPFFGNAPAAGISKSLVPAPSVPLAPSSSYVSSPDTASSANSSSSASSAAPATRPVSFSIDSEGPLIRHRASSVERMLDTSSPFAQFTNVVTIPVDHISPASSVSFDLEVSSKPPSAPPSPPPPPPPSLPSLPVPSNSSAILSKISEEEVDEFQARLNNIRRSDASSSSGESDNSGVSGGDWATL